MLIQKYGWHEWLCHTNYSFLIGASYPEEYLKEASTFGYDSLAITDFNGVYGLARAHQKKGNTKLIYGAEINLAKDHTRPLLEQDTLVLVAESKEGYQNLCRILTEAHKHGKKEAFISLLDLESQPKKGLLAFQPMRGLLRQEGSEQIWYERSTKLMDLFTNNLHFVVSRHLHPSEDYWILPTLKQAKRLGAPVIFSQDAFMHQKERKHVSDLLQAIRLNQNINHSLNYMFVNSERSLHTQAYLEKVYGKIPGYKEALELSLNLSQRCQFSFDELRYQYPQEMIPPQHTALSYLTALTWAAAKKRYGSLLPEKIGRLIQHELNLINKLNFADYFLTVWDIVTWAKSQNILCQGRGSAANSAVCFVLGITSVDPQHFDLLFERFISVERGDPPDIDVDFEHERREEVIQYIYQRYGRHRAAMVANIITFQDKGASQAILKAFNFKEHNDITLKLTEEIKGFPRHLGIHSGGFIISQEPLTQLVAQEPATMPGRSVIQWCKDDIESLGFFKIDILALGMLSAVRKTFQSIKECYGKDFDLSTIPSDDFKTYQMIQKADTVGTFQIESRAQMSMLPRLKPKNFYDLVIEIAIIRPGPIQGGMIHPYLKRRSGKEPITFPDPRLKPILERTLGIPIFQEQVMRIAMAVGNFTPGEANELRRQMGAWSLKGDMGPWLTKLAEGMKEQGLEESFITGILAQMQGFAHYGFPESHAASFALIAYASCYLKCHFPEAFFTALLNSQPMGFYGPYALLQAAKRDGVKIKPVSVNDSSWNSTLEKNKDSGKYDLRLGFHLVTALRKKGADALLTKRQLLNRKWLDWQDFTENSPEIFRSDLTALAAANAFEELGITRQEALWRSEAKPIGNILADIEDNITWRSLSGLEEAGQDLGAMNLTLGPHPALVIKKECWTYPIPLSRLCLARDLSKAKAGTKIITFGLILIKQAPPAAKGMVFLTLEDETGFINLSISKETYANLHTQIRNSAFICAEGILSRHGDYHAIQLTKVHLARKDTLPMRTSPLGYPHHRDVKLQRQV